MRAGGMKSSKCRKESRRNSSGGIHPFLLISTLPACSSEGVGRGMQNLKGCFSSVLSTGRTNLRGGILLYNLVLFIQPASQARGTTRVFPFLSVQCGYQRRPALGRKSAIP